MKILSIGFNGYNAVAKSVCKNQHYSNKFERMPQKDEVSFGNREETQINEYGEKVVVEYDDNNNKIKNTYCYAEPDESKISKIEYYNPDTGYLEKRETYYADLYYSDFQRLFSSETFDSVKNIPLTYESYFKDGKLWSRSEAELRPDGQIEWSSVDNPDTNKYYEFFAPLPSKYQGQEAERYFREHFNSASIK